MGGDGVDGANGVDRDFLAQVPIFAGLPERALAAILGAARMIRAAPGQVLFAEGDLAVSLFVVCDGELEISKRGRNGVEFGLAILKRGDCVGEMSLIDIEARSATVRAVGAATLFSLDLAAIARLYREELESYTLLVLNIAREISRRLRRADQVLVDLGIALAPPGQTLP
jgi:CRP/FNR family transcriptional regulator, cyclic AMP receptor protein